MTKMPLSFLSFVAFLLSATVPVATADTRIRAGAATADATPPLPASCDLILDHPYAPSPVSGTGLDRESGP